MYACMYVCITHLPCGNNFISNIRFRSTAREETGDAEKIGRGRETLYDRTESGMETGMMDTMSLGTQTW